MWVFPDLPPEFEKLRQQTMWLRYVVEKDQKIVLKLNFKTNAKRPIWPMWTLRGLRKKKFPICMREPPLGLHLSGSIILGFRGWKFWEPLNDKISKNTSVFHVDTFYIYFFNWCKLGSRPCNPEQWKCCRNQMLSVFSTVWLDVEQAIFPYSLHEVVCIFVPTDSSDTH